MHIGAHPGFPDLMGFGRRSMNVSPAEAKAYIQYQLGALEAFCRAAGVQMHHVKPHGALYNMAAKDEKLARAIVEGICEVDDRLTLLALSGSEMLLAAEKAGLRAASEVFADRGYQADGTLVPRSKPGAMITDETQAIERVVRMVTEGVVTAVDGTDVPLRADSICVHGRRRKGAAFRAENPRRAGSKGRCAEGAVIFYPISPAVGFRRICGAVLYPIFFGLNVSPSNAHISSKPHALSSAWACPNAQSTVSVLCESEEMITRALRLLSCSNAQRDGYGAVRQPRLMAPVFTSKILPAETSASIASSAAAR